MAVGQLGFWISLISMQSLMLTLTGSDPAWLGLLFFMNFVPMLVFTPFAGLLADRLDRRLILVISFGAVVVIMTALTVLRVIDQVTPASLLPFAFAIGTVFAFFAPANQALVASSVGAQDLGSAVSLMSAASNLSRVVGPTIAAPVIAFTDVAVAFGLYAFASLIQVVILLTRVHVHRHVPEPPAPFVERLKGGLVHARERPPMAAALVVVCASSLFAAAYLALLPVVADQSFGRGTTGFTTMAAVTGLGSMVGALFTGFREGAPSLRTGAALTAMFGVSLAAFSLATNWLLALLLLAIMGAFYFAAMTSLNTLVQLLADENKRGRVMALFTLGWGGLVPVGGLWQGQAASSIGAMQTLGIAGGVTAAIGVGVVLKSVRNDRSAVPSV